MLAAIIDIGSNSVRLVLYHYVGHHAQPVFNEKSACGLGAALVHSNALDPDTKDVVRTIISRFKQIIDVHQPHTIKAIATAAIRESTDGPEFARELSVLLGHPIDVLSGREEAVYAARGVASTTWQARGLVADMGGGSLDIAELLDDGASSLCSIPTGSLGFADYYMQHGRKGLETHIEERLKQCPKRHHEIFYAVGGSFRALASHCMKKSNYPLRIIHDYKMSFAEVAELAEDMQKLDVSSGDYYVGVPRKRQNQAYPAIIVLQKIMQHCHADYVIFSSAGVREGALHAQNDSRTPHDPLLSMVQAMPESSVQTHYTYQLQDWLLRTLPCNDDEKRIVIAFSHISELATTVHPEHRAFMAFERMMATMGYGMTHEQQIILALALYHRYRSKAKNLSAELALLSERESSWAYALGQLADLAHNISAGSADLLARYSLRYEGDVITVNSAGSDTAIIPPNVANWCDGLGETIKALSS